MTTLSNSKGNVSLIPSLSEPYRVLAHSRDPDLQAAFLPPATPALRMGAVSKIRSFPNTTPRSNTSILRQQANCCTGLTP
ncbi:hypothetical protein BDV10DRAFT_176611 [Aspergillus recurvatus]